MIKLNNNRGFHWKTKGNLTFKGIIDDLNSNIQGLNESISNENQLIETLKNSTGFFSIVFENDFLIFAAVDRLRSIPLFYALKNDEFFLSDDAYWIREKINDEVMDQVCKNEFYLSGYVTGKDTLYPNIKQVQAGEYLIFNKLDKRITTEFYFQLSHGDYSLKSNLDLIEELEEIHIKVFQRLINTLENRTAIIPLSGGYDSRLIAVMLKRLGYENVICFTYGKKNNSEALISKAVADQLGYPWIFIEYTNEKWIEWYQSKSKVDYYRYADGLSSIPHIQDVIAVKELVEKKLIPTDSIFIPGHALDFLAGSHIPEKFISKQTSKPKDIINQLLIVHYSLWEDKELLREYQQQFSNRIKNIIDNKDLYSTEEAVDNYERWIWSQRQAKYIAHSLRVYDFYNYEWRMPLWEKEIIQFWEKVNIGERFDRKLFLEYVEDTQSEFIYLQKYTKEELSSFKKMIIKKPLLYNWLIKLRKRKSFSQHSLAWYGLLKNSNLKITDMDKMKNIISYLTYDYFKK
ncbi:asparagine synthase-related protein [Solibacillus silvestris]